MRSIGIETYAAVRLILYAIEKEGLEKTLEELRKACPDLPFLPKPSMIIYESLLAHLESLRDLKK